MTAHSSPFCLQDSSLLTFLFVRQLTYLFVCKTAHFSLFSLRDSSLLTFMFVRQLTTHLFRVHPSVDLEYHVISVDDDSHWRRDQDVRRPRQRHHQQSQEDRRQTRAPTPSGQHIPRQPNAAPVSHVGQAVDVVVAEKEEEEEEEMERRRGIWK